VPQDQIDINRALGTRATISIDPEETEAEHAARLKRESDDARFELVKGYALFFTILAVLLALGSICLYETIWDQTASPETKRWAGTLVASLFTGSVSFVLGQKTAKSK
jgi:drug/metabolite transporter (DMT)-like permease